jgi:DNA polymerase elongation subunit (family B)
MAVKRVMASMYGMTASAGYGWGNITVAQTITSVGREAIHLLLRECESLGYNPVFGHTDSAYVQVPMDKVEWLSGHLSQRAQEKLSVPTLEVEWESYFPYFTIAKKNRYFRSYELSRRRCW